MLNLRSVGRGGLAVGRTIWLVIGLPTTGFGGPERDIRTIIYSVPETLLVVLAATLFVPLPLVLSRFARSRTTVARSL
jgi:hypothetical protein